MDGISNIIFDLGNVILKIDYDAPIKAFEQLGIKDFKNIFSKENQNSMSDDFETGKVTPDDFVNYLLAKCNSGTTSQQVITAWNSILDTFPINRLRLLQQLQLHYSTYLLSNTNALHEVAYNKMLMETVSFPTMGVFFDKIYLSHHIGYRKPDPKAWQLILEENNLVPHETLFLDDSPQHIEAASKLGIRTIHITTDLSMEDVFRAK
jgi:glucose-1-phosphatase